MKLIISLLFAVFTLGASVWVIAQEGYPLDGTWRGNWGQAGAAGTLAVVVMNWDGTAINGRINPGRNNVNFTTASLNADTWAVHFEATSADGQPIIVDGVLENLGSYKRTITGTWKIGGVENQIVLTRE